jgi:hypothetical protein
MNDVLAYYRAIKPRARRTEATAIVHSGSRRTIYECVCGDRHTTSTDWNGRGALHVSRWRLEHEPCLSRWVLARLPAHAAALDVIVQRIAGPQLRVHLDEGRLLVGDPNTTLPLSPKEATAAGIAALARAWRKAVA